MRLSSSNAITLMHKWIHFSGDKNWLHQISSLKIPTLRKKKGFSRTEQLNDNNAYLALIYTALDHAK